MFNFKQRSKASCADKSLSKVSSKGRSRRSHLGLPSPVVAPTH